MKLWTTVDLRRLPVILQTGLDNPFSEEIIFRNDPELVAENALTFPEELAFIETEIPDDEIDEWFYYCIGSVGDDHTDAAAMLEWDIEAGRVTQEEVDERMEFIAALETIETGSANLELLGYACLYRVLPPEMLKLLDPTTMLEAKYTGDVDALAEAVETTEATGFTSLSPNFWVWLMLFMSQIFGPDWRGAYEAARAAEQATLKRERKKGRKSRKARRPSQRKKRRRRSGSQS